VILLKKWYIPGWGLLEWLVASESMDHSWRFIDRNLLLKIYCFGISNLDLFTNGKRGNFGLRVYRRLE
jgi:hypothetical protein